MNAFMERLWPPTKTWKLSLLWAFLTGFIVQFGLPVLLNAVGAERAAWLVTLPGMWPILRATGGFFSSLAPLGYLFVFSVNTAFYALILLAGLRMCARVRRQSP
jgi:hypothetical protein